LVVLIAHRRLLSKPCGLRFGWVGADGLAAAVFVV